MPLAIQTWARLILVLLSSAVVGLILYSPMFDSAHADTGPYENLPPASIGNRNASLFLGINPPVLTSGSFHDVRMTFRLFDANNNQTIPFTTYFIKVTRGISPDSPALLQDFFQSPSGQLSLKIQPVEGPLTIYGNQEPILNAWVADPGGTVNIKGPVFNEGGLYHFHVEIFGIDNARNIFDTANAPRFDTFLNVGDVTTINFSTKEPSSTVP